MEMMAMSTMNGDRDEDFNTRFGSYRGWQMAVERVKPIPRTVAQLDLTAMVLDAGCETPEQVVDYLAGALPVRAASTRARARNLAAFLEQELGTRDMRAHRDLCGRLAAAAAAPDPEPARVSARVSA